MVLGIFSCQDSPTTDYIPKVYIEAYLIVDKPITNIKVMFSQPMLDSFKYENYFIRTSQVYIKYDDKILKLITAGTGVQGYYYPDSSITVLPAKQYNLEVILEDGTVITGQTVTPDRFSWINPPPDTLYYPKDTVNLTDDPYGKLSWTTTKSKAGFIARITCLDTLGYGKYLNGDTTDKNRRIFRPWMRPQMQGYNDMNTWGLLASNETPVVWTSFKWYGWNDVTMMIGDFNYMRWALQYFRASQYNPLLSNIKNGIGCFGSASTISKKVFIIKNQR